MARDLRYYNIGLNKVGEWIRIGDKAFPVPPLGDYVDIPPKYEPLIRRRYGESLSRNPNAAKKVVSELARENEDYLTDEMLQAEMERLQSIAQRRIAEKVSKKPEEVAPQKKVQEVAKIDPSFLPVLTQPLREYTVVELKEMADQTGVAYPTNVKKDELIASMVEAGFEDFGDEE